ncbi:MAG TPA: proline--tRNA ligase [Candidatus Omnitrophota bacterium]|nr:proline--tRNA ligase [Candidatus Omnitrophota bacterium]HPD85011.1 proline--tRNA ligase [Candidatus Omnitrophota bacterium]HRZ03869.1 proline--tRNA ligase [Candidatus Omnitrophota bacterium]
MRWSSYFIPTAKEAPVGTEAVSHQLLLRAGLIHMLTSGVYSYLPLGLRVLNRIQDIIREEMNAIGAQELFLPCLQPLELWQQTGRDKTLAEVMIRFKDKRGKDMCLGPTHEEIITDLVKDFVQSYRQLPLVLYQIQTKFRDEIRPRFGIVRACEFIMKDAYSFDRDKKGLERNYQLMYGAYEKIFKRCNLNAIAVKADSGAMGGDISHEFMVPGAIGEDAVLICNACGQAMGGAQVQSLENGSCPQCAKGTLEKKVAIELGHIFQLGTKYSQAQGANFLDENGQQQTIIMGCYGIGVSRLIAAVVESHNDAAGIIWPKEVAPFDVEILPVQMADSGIMELAENYYQDLSRLGLEALIDDRDVTAGVKFNDADLIGIPLRIVIGKRTFAEGKVEIKNRRTGEVMKLGKDEVSSKIKELIEKV